MRITLYRRTGFSPRATRLLAVNQIQTFLLNGHADFEYNTQSNAFTKGGYEFRSGQTRLMIRILPENNAHPLEWDYLCVYGEVDKFYYFVVDVERVPLKAESYSAGEALYAITIQPDYWATFAGSLSEPLTIKGARLLETNNEQFFLDRKYHNVIEMLPPSNYGFGASGVKRYWDIGAYGIQTLGDIKFRLFVLCNTPAGQLLLCRSKTWTATEILNNTDCEKERLQATSLVKVNAGLWVGNPDIEPVGAWYLPVNNYMYNAYLNVPPVISSIECISAVHTQDSEGKDDGGIITMNYPTLTSYTRVTTIPLINENVSGSPKLDILKQYIEVGTVGHRLRIDNVVNQDIKISTRLTVSDREAPQFILSLQGTEIDITNDFSVAVMYNQAAARENERNLSLALSAFGSAVQIALSAGTGNIVGAALGVGGLIQGAAGYVSGRSGVAQVTGVNGYYATIKNVAAGGSGIAVWTYTPANLAELEAAQAARGYAIDNTEARDITISIFSTDNAAAQYYRIADGDIDQLPIDARNYIKDKFISGVRIIYNAAEF